MLTQVTMELGQGKVFRLMVPGVLTFQFTAGKTDKVQFPLGKRDGMTLKLESENGEHLCHLVKDGGKAKGTPGANDDNYSGYMLTIENDARDKEGMTSIVKIMAMEAADAVVKREHVGGNRTMEVEGNHQSHSQQQQQRLADYSDSDDEVEVLSVLSSPVGSGSGGNVRREEGVFVAAASATATVTTESSPISMSPFPFITGTFGSANVGMGTSGAAGMRGSQEGQQRSYHCDQYYNPASPLMDSDSFTTHGYGYLQHPQQQQHHHQQQQSVRNQAHFSDYVTYRSPSNGRSPYNRGRVTRGRGRSHGPSQRGPTFY